MLTALIISLCLVVFSFNRYMPVRNVHAVETGGKDVVLVDLRDFQDSAKYPVNGAINIPCGYVKRFRREIPNRHIVIIASNNMEKNYGARLLKKYGFTVEGYMIKGPFHKEMAHLNNFKRYSTVKGGNQNA